MHTFEYEKLYFYFDNWKNYAKYQNVPNCVAQAFYSEVYQLSYLYEHHDDKNDQAECMLALLSFVFLSLI